MRNNFKAFETNEYLLSEDITRGFIILFYVGFMSTLCHYVGRSVFVQPVKKPESGNKIPVTQHMRDKSEILQNLKYYIKEKWYN